MMIYNESVLGLSVRNDSKVKSNVSAEALESLLL